MTTDRAYCVQPLGEDRATSRRAWVISASMPPPMLLHIADLDSLAQENRRISVRHERRQGDLKAKITQGARSRESECFLSEQVGSRGNP
jgi:hypothetical protein